MANETQLTISSLIGRVRAIQDTYGDLPIETEDRYADFDFTDTEIIGIYLPPSKDKIILLRGHTQYSWPLWRIELGEYKYLDRVTPKQVWEVRALSQEEALSPYTRWASNRTLTAIPIIDEGMCL